MRRSPWVRQIASVPLVVVLSATFAWAQDGPADAQAPPGQSDPESRCDRHGFSSLFTCVWHDLQHVTRGESLTWFAVGGALGAGSLLLDDEISNSLMDTDPDHSLAAGAVLGEAGLHFGIPLAMYAVARANDWPGTEALAITLFRTQVVNGVLTRSLKLLPRARPYQDTATATKGSFPSGHTSAAFATATVIGRQWGWRGGLPAYLVAAYVGATRLQNLHYLSDVSFGAALGIVSGLAVDLSPRRAAISPMIGPGVKGVLIEIR